MQYILIAFAALAGAILTPRYLPSGFVGNRRRVIIVAFRTLFLLIAFGSVAITSIISIPANQVGVVRKIYGFSNLAPGHIIATQGETGYQAEIIPPEASASRSFFNVLNSVDLLPVVVVPNGFYGRIVASDGEALVGRRRSWPTPGRTTSTQKFLDAEYFMTHGGQKGLQLSVLKPGVYPLNLALFQVKIGYTKNGSDITVDQRRRLRPAAASTTEQAPLDTSITRVPAGSVGVVRSSVQNAGVDCKARTARTEDGGLDRRTGAASAARASGTRSLPPNDYYLNRDAYDVTLVSTRVTTLEFKGGFTRRYIDLKVDAKGDFTQTERTATSPSRGAKRRTPRSTPRSKAGKSRRSCAPSSRSPRRTRRSWSPRSAARTEVDQRIVVPSIRSIVRNVYGGSITVPETDDNGGRHGDHPPDPGARHDREPHRAGTGDSASAPRSTGGARASTSRKSGSAKSAIPPELLLARQREQLAGQLRAAYVQEQSRAGATPEDRTGARHRRPAARPRHGADRRADRAPAQEPPPGRRPRRAAVPRGTGGRPDGAGRSARQGQRAEAAEAEAGARTARRQHPELIANLKLPQVYVAGGGAAWKARPRFSAASRGPKRRTNEPTVPTASVRRSSWTLARLSS